jgi:ABC-2 type transport system ATP-binding protein
MSEVVLQTEGLTKSYGSLKAVDKLSLEIHKGEVFGFLGPNGAGKTTSINMMCGLLKPDAGRVLIQGKPISGGDADVRARVGVCPQEVVLWDRMTCIEQLQFMGEMYGMSGKVARQSGYQLLEEFDLVEKSRAQARTLSGGMRRRLNLALSVVHHPDLVVLDEPEAGLDPQSRVKVREYIRSLAREKTVILTTHNMDEADRVADRVAIIDHGVLLVLDTPEALKNKAGEGNVLEIRLMDAKEDGDRARMAMDDLGEGARTDVVDGILQIRAPNAIALLPKIREKLTEMGIASGAVHMRENTLEDVFIQLTGRRLRS